MPWNRAKEVKRRKAERNVARKGDERSKSYLDTFFTFLLMLFTGALVGVGYLQWQTLEKADKTSRQTQRAWVGLDDIIKIDVLETTPRLHVESRYRIKNFGNGPALKVMVSGWFETPEKIAIEKEGAKFACASAVHFATGMVPMSHEMHNPGPMGHVLLPTQGHDEFIGSKQEPWTGDAQPGLTHFKFIGCVAYVDQFHAVHWTRFCMEPDIFGGQQLMNKDIRLRFCSLYNDTDETDSTN